MIDAGSSAAELTEVVQTSHGPVFGRRELGLSVFKGIRYGAPPVERARFQPPKAPEPWSRPEPAIAFAASAIQFGREWGERPGRGAGWSRLSTSEDCLFLNLWTPALDGRRRPVMVWLHGGGFANGSGSAPKSDGGNLALRGDVVVVSLTHRLNAFGYLHLGDIFGDDFATSGVAGMLDIALALTWVRDNIAAFGGDPSSVTLFGSSGGGWKICLLMTMPSARGLFHRAIVQSGPLLRARTRAEGTEAAGGLLTRLGVSTPADLVRLPASAISQAAAGLTGDPMKLFSPVVDGEVIPHHPFDPDGPPLARDIPLIVGTNKDEHTLFLVNHPDFGAIPPVETEIYARKLAGDRGPALAAALRRAFPHYSESHIYAALGTCCGIWGDSLRLAELKARQGGAPVYMYLLAWETPVGDGRLRSPHAMDGALVFDNVDRAAALTGSGPEAHALAAQMSGAWAAFARHGDPNTGASPHWPPYDLDRRATLRFDLESRVVEDPLSEARAILNG